MATGRTAVHKREKRHYGEGAHGVTEGGVELENQ